TLLVTINSVFDYFIQILSRMNSFWSRLHDIQLLTLTVYSPLDIHRCPSRFYFRIVLFYQEHPLRQQQYFFIFKAEPTLKTLFSWYNLYPFVHFITIYHHFIFHTKLLLNDRFKPLLHGWFKNNKFIWRNRSLYN